MTRQRSLWVAVLSLALAAAGLTATGAVADTGASAAVKPAATTTAGPPTVQSTIHTGQRCQVEYRTTAWNSGLNVEIVITNTGTYLYPSWQLVFTLPSGQAITSGWNASYSPGSGQVTARNAPYNAEIAPNASISIGFQASHTGDTTEPTFFQLNGAVCANA